MLQIPVKAAAISNLTDARYFAAREVQWIGFSIAPGNGNQVAEVRAMKEWLDGVQFMAEFGLQPAEEISQVADYLGLETIQVTHFTPTETIQALAGLKVHKEVIVTPDHTLEEILEHLVSLQGLVAAYQMDFTRVADSSYWDDEKLKSIASEFPVWYELNWNPDTILDWWGSMPAEGITLKGGEEEKVGYKSFDELDDILDAIETLEE